MPETIAPYNLVSNEVRFMLAGLLRENNLDQRAGVSAEALADYLASCLHHFVYALDCARPALGARQGPPLNKGPVIESAFPGGPDVWQSMPLGEDPEDPEQAPLLDEGSFDPDF